MVGGGRGGVCGVRTLCVCVCEMRGRWGSLWGGCLAACKIPSVRGYEGRVGILVVIRHRTPRALPQKTGVVFEPAGRWGGGYVCGVSVVVGWGWVV